MKLIIPDPNESKTWVEQSIKWIAHDGRIWYYIWEIQQVESGFVKALMSVDLPLDLIPETVPSARELGNAINRLVSSDVWAAMTNLEHSTTDVITYIRRTSENWLVWVEADGWEKEQQF